MAAHPDGRRRRREGPHAGVARARGGRRRGGTTDRWLAPPSFWPTCALHLLCVLATGLWRGCKIGKVLKARHDRGKHLCNIIPEVFAIVLSSFAQRVK